MLTPAEIRSAFAAPPAPVPVTLAYRLRLLGILAGLSTLVALYLALIGLVALLAWYWLIYGVSAVSASAIPVLTVWISLAPPAAAVVIILGLIRPLLRRRPAPPKPMALSADNEPALFQFVDRLSAMLDAPRPAEVCVDMAVNANAGFVGWSGLVTGKLRLTIGLPLAAAFTLPQMAGVLAHELGHFSQGAGMRSCFLIANIRDWLLRVAHERDSWDAWLERHRRAGRWILIVIANVAWLGLKISRKYLAALARAAQWMTAAFSRHMEFDADRHETAIVGAAVFEQTAMRLRQLLMAADSTWRTVDEGWAMGRAPDDVPGMIAAVEQILTDTAVARVREEALARQTRPSDMHPSDSERIAATRAFDAPSLFTLEGEARLLFKDLPALSREATLYHYKEIAKLNSDGVRFVTVEESVAILQARSAGAAAVHTLFHCSPEFASAWVRLPARIPAGGEGTDGQCELDASKAEPAFRAAVEKAQLHFCARAIRDAGVTVIAKSFRLQGNSVGAVRSEQAASEGAFMAKIAELNRTAKPAIDALERAAGSVWERNSTVFLFQNGAFLTDEVRNLWRLAGALSESLDDMWRIRWLVAAMELVRLNRRAFTPANSAILLQDLQTNAEALMESVKSRIAGVVLEGGEASPAMAVIQGLVAHEPGRDRGALLSFLRRAESLRIQVLCRLAHFATAYGSSPREVQAQAAEASD
jgi:Zn-dependent protease with chaperone function